MARSSTSGQGRPRGTPNKLNADLKAMILGALQDAGGRDYLARQAELSPAAFMSLLGKVLPMQLTGENGGAVVFQWADAVPPSPALLTIDVESDDEQSAE